jgi:hypothetical protein
LSGCGSASLHFTEKRPRCCYRAGFLVICLRDNE